MIESMIVKLTHHSGSVCDGLFLSGKGLRLKHLSSLLWHVRGWEVTEGGVLWPGEQLIIRGLPCLGACPGQAFLQMVLEDLTLSKSGSLTAHSLLSHFVISDFFLVEI